MARTFATNLRCRVCGEGYPLEAIHACERYYPAFQYVIWGGKDPGEAVTAACLDPQGEA